MNIQRIVAAELRRQKMTTYRLWKLVEAQGVNKQTVYDFVAGRIAIRSDQLGYILDALGIELKVLKRHHGVG